MGFTRGTSPSKYAIFIYWLCSDWNLPKPSKDGEAKEVMNPLFLRERDYTIVLTSDGMEAI